MRTELFLSIRGPVSISPCDGFIRIGFQADRDELLDMLDQVATALSCLDSDPEFRVILDAAKIAGELPAKIQMIDIARMTPEELETAHAEFITNKPDWTEFQI